MAAPPKAELERRLAGIIAYLTAPASPAPASGAAAAAAPAAAAAAAGAGAVDKGRLRALVLADNSTEAEADEAVTALWSGGCSTGEGFKKFMLTLIAEDGTEKLELLERAMHKIAAQHH